MRLSVTLSKFRCLAMIYLCSGVAQAQQAVNDSIWIYDSAEDFPRVGFTVDNSAPAQTWMIGVNLYELAGIGSNEFSIVDLEAQSAPFTIFPGAPNQSLIVQSDGSVSLAAGRLAVVGDDAIEEEVQVYVENANTATFGSPKKLFVVKNNGPVKFSMLASDSDEWAFNARSDAFRISKQGSGQVEMEVLVGGNMEIKGTLTQGSSRASKQSIEAVSPESVLEKVFHLPIAEWSYKHDGDEIRHLGPMSEDFFATFGLGATDKGLTSIDTSGVALAAIQGLKREKDAQLAEKDTQLEALRNSLLEQSKRIKQMEVALSELLNERSTGNASTGSQ